MLLCLSLQAVPELGKPCPMCGGVGGYPKNERIRLQLWQANLDFGDWQWQWWEGRGWQCPAQRSTRVLLVWVAIWKNGGDSEEKEKEKPNANATVSAHVISGLPHYRFALMVSVSVSFWKSKVWSRDSWNLLSCQQQHPCVGDVRLLQEAEATALAGPWVRWQESRLALGPGTSYVTLQFCTDLA